MDPKQELLERIKTVRRDWTQIICLQGVAWILGVTVVTLAFALGLSGLDGLPSWAVVLLRLVLITVVVLTAFIKLVRPLLERPEDIQFARLVEEKHPGFKDCFVSAIEIVNKPSFDSGPFGALLLHDVLERTSKLRLNDIVSRTKYKKIVALSGIFLACLFGTAYFSNVFFPNGSARLFAGLLEPPPTPVVSIELSPGNMTVPIGSDVVLEAIIKGVDSERATIHFRYDNTSRWEASGMEVTPVVVPTFRHLLFNVREPVRYYVKASGHKSDEYVISVADLPQVQSLDYKYIYPSYTGLKSRTEEDGLDIVAIRGTSVEVQVNVDQELSSGRFVFDDGSELKLKTSSGSEASTLLRVDKDSSFRIELVSLQGQRYLGLHEYGVEALEDEQPFVRFTEPGRDFKASTVEEVFTELSAEDDIGIELMELYFSVNGGEIEKVELFSNRGRAPNKISSSYTFFLEEYEIEPGDFFTYYGKAVDSMHPGNEVMTDIYFIEVRPFGKEYFQGQSGGQNNRQGDADTSSAAALSRRQKEIVAATFRLIRDEGTFGKSEFSDNIRAVADSQTTLAKQTRTLMARLTSRGLVFREGIGELSHYMGNALEQMGPAARELRDENLGNALLHEQKALQFLMRAETLFNEIQITQGGGSSGGSAEDLADLFDLELDQSKNQYETLQRSELSKNSAELDEALRRLEELARRQQKMVEEQTRSKQSGGSLRSRRIHGEEIRRETQRLARQLDSLSRKNNNREMADVGRALQEAARNMQESRAGSSQQQKDASESAMKQLEKAQELLLATQGGSLDDRLAGLQRKAKSLSDRQAEIAQQTEVLARDPAANITGRTDQIRELKKDAVNSLREIERSLNSLQGNHKRQETASRIRSASNLIRSGRLFDKMNQGQQLLENGYFEYARQRERELEQNFNDLEREVGEAAVSAANTDEKRVQAALNHTSETILRLESLQRRMENDNYSSQGAGVVVREADQREDDRQMTREWEERLRDVTEIQDLLGKNSQLQVDLSKILNAIRLRIEEYPSGDSEELGAIKRSIIDPFRSIELNLSRQLQLLITKDSILSVNEEEIPAGYRSLVEDYYKRLSEEETRQKND